MKTTIFCFSGTGNSLAAAKSIGKQLGNSKIILITGSLDVDSLEISQERVGIVCPVYFGGNIPPVVTRFIQKLELTRVKYIFAVTTAGAMHGKSLDLLSQLVDSRGGYMNAGFKLSMPGNYIAMYGAWPAALQKFMLKRSEKRVNSIAHDIKNKKTNRPIVTKKQEIKLLSERIPDFHHLARDYRVSDACTGCQVCAKVCPAGNIRMNNGKPEFGDFCERCMACIQWCPAMAIEYKDKTQKRKRYTNPQVKASDLFREGVHTS